MSNALERWKARRQGDVTLPSGTTATVELVSVSAEILAGTFPAQVVGLARAMESGTADLEHELTDEEIAVARRYRHVIVSRMVRAVDGEAVELTEEDAEALPISDIEILWAYHLRLLPLHPNEDEADPFDQTSDSETSPDS